MVSIRIRLIQIWSDLMSERLLCKKRRRLLPRTFSWLDHRLVREGHLTKVSADAGCLYLFLVTVGDRDGVSFYSDHRLLEALPFVRLKAAREELVDHGLIAWELPNYQVLEVPEITATGSAQESISLAQIETKVPEPLGASVAEVDAAVAQIRRGLLR
jgi:hypothetical protein